MFEIHLKCWDPPYTEPPYEDKVEGEFYNKTDAMLCMLQCAVDEAMELNGVTDEALSDTRFVVCRNIAAEPNGDRNDVVIFAYNEALGLHEQPITAYDVVWVNKTEVDKYNNMLKEEFGDDLTLQICASGEGEDVVYYFCGASISESDHYESAKECYEEAQDYMRNIDLYT